MRLNQKRVMSWCGGLSIAVVAAFSNAQNASAQNVPVTDVGQRSVIAEGDFYRLVEERLPDPATNFRAYNVWAEVKTQNAPGRFVNAFQELNITGVHQVWEAPTRPGRPPTETPYDDFFVDLAEQLRKLDSRAGWLGDDESNGASPTETNDGSNPAGIDPEQWDPESGYIADDLIIGVGEVGVTSRGQGPPAALGLSIRPANLPLAYVVLYDGPDGPSPDNYALLSGEIGGEGDGNESNGGEIDQYLEVAVGTVAVIPEPAAGILTLVGLASLLGLRRRNG